MTQISITVSETAHWHALISRAEFHANQLLPQGVEDYLVRLFMRFEQEEKPIFLLKKSTETEVSMEHKLQRLGDQCLLLCGFYPEASEEYGVALQEFTSMGSEAYEKLTKLDNDETAIIFEYLAGNFENISAMLCYINDVSGEPLKRNSQADINDYQETMAVSFNPTEKLPFSSPISTRVLN